MRYLNEPELRRLAKENELILQRQNGIWTCGRGAVHFPVYFSLVADDVRIRYDDAWRVSFSISTNEEFTVVCEEYSAVTSALYDVGLLTISWLQDAYFSLKIELEVLEIVQEAIKFLVANADNDEPLPDRLIDVVHAYEAPSTLSALLQIREWRKP